MKNKIAIITIIISLFSMESFAQLSKDSIESLFPYGNFVSFRDNIACYRLKGIKKGGMYGFCKYVPTYKPFFSTRMRNWDKSDGETTKVLNSKCYTIIAPIYDYALPFKEGWAPVCINKKWTYVSEDNHYLLDFVLDAAFPFQNGKAKVVFEGENYEINLAGEGLPYSAYRDTYEKETSLKANTINQLFSEAQYEKTMTEGMTIYNMIVNEQNGQLPELSASVLGDAVQIAFAAMSAQNSLMSLTVKKNTDLFNKYRNNRVDRYISFESRHPAINKHNAESYFTAFRNKYAVECRDVVLEMDRADFKSAIIKFEKWITSNNINVEENISLMMTYYYLSELSDDFENANKLLIKMAREYEEYDGNLDIEELPLGVLLANIKRYKSAESLFTTIAHKISGEKKSEKLFLLYYNMALMYQSVKNKQKSIDYFAKALKFKIPEEMESVRLECMSDLINSKLSIGKVDENLLIEYVNAEIDYNTTIYEKYNSLMINRFWGNSMDRMQRLFEYLGKCNNPTFLKSAFSLSVFIQGIVFDIEKYLAKSIHSSDNLSLQQQFQIYLEQKSRYKGIDVFDLISITDTQRDSIYSLFKEEEIIKNKVITRCKHYIPTAHYKQFISKCNNNVGMIDVIVHRDSFNLFRIGAFLNSSNGSLSYIPISIEDEFSKDDFWKVIDLPNHFSTDDEIYVYYGVLDTLGLEYHKTNIQEPVYNRYKLHRSSSLANVFNKGNAYTNNNVVLYGGLDYGDRVAVGKRGAGKGFLKYSVVEIDAIADVLEKVGMDVCIKDDVDGTAESIYLMSGRSPKILHFATHGFSSQKVRHYNLLEDRFNYYRQNTDIQQREWLMNNTGLLTSIDSIGNNLMYSNTIASCDFSQTELVVLSACSTMSGSTSDGNMQIVGLTTAFSLSSVQNIISSLRDVDDEKTSEFMMIFYKLYVGSSNLYESFRKTVITMQERYPDTPYYWNSFVLIEN